MMVYLIDKRAASAGVPRPAGIAGLARVTGFEDRWRQVLHSLPGHANALVLFSEPTDGVDALLAQVAASVGNPWSIYMLRILAHGAPGHIELGTGVRHAQARLFEQVAHYMTPAHLRGRGVQIHGCNVGSGPQGRRLMQAMADHVGMPVSASSAIQTPDTRFNFEGPVATVEPRPARRH